MVKLTPKRKIANDIDNLRQKMGKKKITDRFYNGSTEARLRNFYNDVKNEYKVYKDNGNEDVVPNIETALGNALIDTKERKMQRQILEEQQAFEDAYLRRKDREQEKIEKLRLDLFANANVKQIKNENGVLVEAPIEYLPELKLSRSLTRAGAFMTGIDRRNKIGEWSVEELRKYKVPLRR